MSTQLPTSGVSDFKYLERGNFLVAIAVSLWLIAPRLGVRWARDPRHDLVFLAFAAAISVTLHLNFFAFHGLGVYVHPHDLGHYYLGSKYFRELGYGTLYPAVLQVEREASTLGVTLARDPATGELKPAELFEAPGLEAKRRFSPDRWEAFRRDVSFFRSAMGEQWASFTLDHGFNATPAWVAIGGPLAQRVPTRPAPILALSLIDSMLLIAMFVVIAALYGARAMLLCLTHYCIVYGTGFGYTGGAFLRYLWLVAAVLALCCLERGWHALAGFSLAAATALAVFPLFIFISVGFVVLARFVMGGGIGVGHRRFVLSFGLTVLALTGGASWLLGAPVWTEFKDNIAAHVESPAMNRVGLDPLLTPGDRNRTFDEAYRSAQAARRSPAFSRQRGIALLVVMGLLVACSRRIRDGEAFVLGLALVFAAVMLSGYYYSILIVWTLVFRNRPAWLLGVFGLEAATGAVSLFEDREWVVYLYRSLMLGSLYLAAFVAILARRKPGEESPALGSPGGGPGTVATTV
jgi:hypothetical protein